MKGVISIAIVLIISHVSCGQLSWGYGAKVSKALDKPELFIDDILVVENAEAFYGIEGHCFLNHRSRISAGIFYQKSTLSASVNVQSLIADRSSIPSFLDNFLDNLEGTINASVHYRNLRFPIVYSHIYPVKDRFSVLFGGGVYLNHLKQLSKPLITADLNTGIDLLQFFNTSIGDNELSAVDQVGIIVDFGAEYTIDPILVVYAKASYQKHVTKSINHTMNYDFEYGDQNIGIENEMQFTRKTSKLFLEVGLRTNVFFKRK